MAQRLTSFASRFTPQSSRPSTPSPEEIKKQQMYKLFPKTDPAIDGEDCEHDCESCSLRYPAKFEIDEEDELFGKIDKWDTHLIVATGKTDWVRDVADEEGSIMEAVGKGETRPANGKMMLSASNIPLPDSASTIDNVASSTVLLLPSFTFIDNMTPSRVPELITNYVNHSPTNQTPLSHNPIHPSTKPSQLSNLSSHPLTPRPCPHKYLILLCSQKTRDARCGQSAPILRREFERNLRPLGLYRDLHDERLGGVGIYFISHVGGHRYAANVMVYRKTESRGEESRAENGERKLVDGIGKLDLSGGIDDARENKASQTGNGVLGESPHEAVNGRTRDALGEASQCIWLARVKPQDCENIIKYTVLQGKVVKPESQLRGGFDREKGAVSW